MNQLENCQARYRSNTWMGRTRTDGPDELEPTKFDCISFDWEINVFLHNYLFNKFCWACIHAREPLY